MGLSRHECAKRLKRSVGNEMLDQLAQRVDIARMRAAKPPEPADTKLVSEVEGVAQMLVKPPCG